MVINLWFKTIKIYCSCIWSNIKLYTFAKKLKMRTHIFVLATIFSIAFSSCKKDDSNKVSNTNESATEIKSNFTVEINAVTDKDDDLAVYYTEDGSTNFTAEKALWGSIKAGGKGEPLIFQFPNEIIPQALRLDFGIKRKEQQGNVTLKSFKISCYNKNFEAKGSDFFTYFVKNDSIDTQIDATAGTITFKQNLKNNAAAFFYPGPALNSEIKKLTK